MDVDFAKNQRNFLQQLFQTQIMLNNLKPCFVRHSSSKKGLHALKFYLEDNLYDEKLCNYKKFCKPLEWAEEIYDDPKRKLIREIRIKYGLTSSVLFDIKSFRNITRVAGEWQFIQDAWEVERFLDFFFDFWRY
jgi:hypothetical protein